MKKKQFVYRVEVMPEGVPNCHTIEDLEKYLNKNPYPKEKLFSVQFTHACTWVLIWRRRENVKTVGTGIGTGIVNPVGNGLDCDMEKEPVKKEKKEQVKKRKK